jgi:hypothetical protein
MIASIFFIFLETPHPRVAPPILLPPSTAAAGLARAGLNSIGSQTALPGAPRAGQECGDTH